MPSDPRHIKVKRIDVSTSTVKIIHSGSSESYNIFILREEIIALRPCRCFFARSFYIHIVRNTIINKSLKLLQLQYVLFSNVEKTIFCYSHQSLSVNDPISHVQVHMSTSLVIPRAAVLSPSV